MQQIRWRSRRPDTFAGARRYNYNAVKQVRIFSVMRQAKYLCFTFLLT